MYQAYFKKDMQRSRFDQNMHFANVASKERKPAEQIFQQDIISIFDKGFV